jgi:SAM-dependent methyltransferase
MAKLATLDNKHAGLYITDNLINCISCGFAHLYPLPDAKAVDRYYGGDYFYSQHSPQDWFSKEKAEYDAGLWDAYYSYLAGLLDPNKPVIDIGCGSGLFLDYLCKHGWSQWQLYGIEPSRTARNASPIGHRLFKELAKEELVVSLRYGEAQYKAYGAIKGNVVLSLVLEHIPDPARFLEEDVLPHLDGRLVVVVPSEFNLLQRLVGLRYPDKKYWFVSRVHCNYLTRTSLKSLLERVGLRVVHTGATFPTEIWPLIGRNHIGNDELGRRNHLWRLELERRWPGIFRLYGWLGRWFNVGREIVMVAEK